MIILEDVFNHDEYSLMQISLEVRSDFVKDALSSTDKYNSPQAFASLKREKETCDGLLKKIKDLKNDTYAIKAEQTGVTEENQGIHVCFPIIF